MENYYVTVCVFTSNAGPPAKYALALGPYDEHQDALDRVADVRKYVSPSDPFSSYSYGTSKVDSDQPGKLNDELGYEPEGLVSSDTPEEAVAVAVGALADAAEGGGSDE